MMWLLTNLGLAICFLLLWVVITLAFLFVFAMVTSKLDWSPRRIPGWLENVMIYGTLGVTGFISGWFIWG